MFQRPGYLSVISTDIFMYTIQFVYFKVVTRAYEGATSVDSTIVQTNGVIITPFDFHCTVRMPSFDWEHSFGYQACLRSKAHTYVNDMLCFVCRTAPYIFFENKDSISLRHTTSNVILLSFGILLYVISFAYVYVYDSTKLIRTTKIDVGTISDATLLATGEVLLLLDNRKIRFLNSGFEISVVGCHNITASRDRIFALGHDSLHTFLYDGTRVTTALPFNPLAISATFGNFIYLHSADYIEKCFM